MTAEQEVELIVKALAVILTELQKLNAQMDRIVKLLEQQEQRYDAAWRAQNE